jgi:putative transposase
MAASAVSHERSGPMKRSKFSEEQIVFALRQAEAGTPVGDLCRQLGVSNATFYAWKKKYAHHRKYAN